ncbi:MAG: S8 family serine peptidase [Cyclobacteriaceae bacterium]
MGSKLTNFLVFFLLLAWQGRAQNKVQQNELVRLQGNTILLKTAEKMQSKRRLQKEQAIQWAEKEGWEIKKISTDGRYKELQKITAYGTPLYYSTYNTDAANSSRASSLWTGGSTGLNLNGESMVIGAWDGDAVRNAHQEFGDRVSFGDGSRFFSSNQGTEHATHVAGTLIAAGVSSSAKGMAPEASLISYDWNFDESEMASFAASGFLISNHSYGYSTERRDGWEDWRFGHYDEVAENWDIIAYEAPYYLIVKASGNDLNDNKNISRNGYDLLEGAGTSKNVLVVGAVRDVDNYIDESSVVLAGFSSTGPTDDGRIKPDIVGNGVSVRSSSSFSNNDYETLDGTSMSSPNVSGSMLLLQQHYNNLNDAFMKSATLRGLVIHTAKETGTDPGPDYRYGWGLIDVEAAAEVITTNGESTSIEEHELQEGQSFQKVIKADGLSPLVVTICWTDPSGNPLPDQSSSENSTQRMLVNDLDCSIQSGNTTYLPWTLDPENMAAPATVGTNNLDNVEKIEIANPSFGEYVVNVEHNGNLRNESQYFSLIISGVVASSCVSEIPGNLTASNITDQSSIIGWNPLLGVNNYEGRYREKGVSEWQSFNTEINSFALDNLLSGTVYEVEMQSLCSQVDISAFSEPMVFQTDCRPDVPQNVFYDDITTSSIHIAWDTVRAVEAFEIRYRSSGNLWETAQTQVSEVFIDGLVPGDNYEFQVSALCNVEDTPDFSSSLAFQPYCLASGDNAQNEWIEQVQIGSIDNISGNDNGYGDFSQLGTDLEAGSTIEMGLQAGHKDDFPKFWTIWIDYNRNGDFNDLGERIVSLPADSDDPSSVSFQIPNSVPLGRTLLRVSLKYNEVSGSCEFYDFGETEDYTINIQEEVDTQSFVAIRGTGLSNQSPAGDVVVYPNPASDRISLNLDRNLNGRQVSIVDMSGNVLLSLPFDSRMVIPITNLKGGIYLVKVETNTGAIVTRFMKQ